MQPFGGRQANRQSSKFDTSFKRETQWSLRRCGGWLWLAYCCCDDCLWKRM